MRIPCPHVNVKDTVGAGDCFVGTFAYLLACQLYDHPSETVVDFKTVCEFVQKSCYASSYSVQYEGGFDKYPTSIIDEWNSSLLVLIVCCIVIWRKNKEDVTFLQSGFVRRR